MTLTYFFVCGGDGGYRPRNAKPTNLDVAAKDGRYLEEYDEIALRTMEMLLDPDMWRAVGRVSSWDPGEWRTKMDAFVEKVEAGKPVARAMLSV